MARRKHSARFIHSHRLLEARSLAMHVVIAAKIERHPTLLSVARKNMRRWQTRWQGRLPAWHQQWCRILKRPWPEIASIMTEPSEEGARLRQSSPFGGVLSAAERRRISDAFKLDASETLAAKRRDQWRRENADAIAEYNDLVKRSGTLVSRRTT
jgi:hypothetical protein